MENFLETSSARLSTFRSFKIILFVGSSILSLLVLAEALRFLPVHGENLTAESSTVLIAMRWSHGQPLYGDFRVPPFFITPFPPGLYVLLALAYKAGFASVEKLMLFGRSLSLLCLLAIAGLTYFWNRAAGLSRDLSVLSAPLFLSFPALLPWATTVRQDFPGLFFVALGGFLIYRSSSKKWIALAALAAAVSFLIKHSLVALPTAVVVWLLLRKRWKDALMFASLWFLVVGAVVGYFQWASSGMMKLNISGSKVYGSSSLQNIHDALVTILFARGHQAVILTFSLALVGAASIWKTRNTQRAFFACYFFSSLFFALLASALSNAALNHFIEPALTWALLAPIGLEGLQSEWPSLYIPAFCLLTFELMLLLPAIDVQRWNTINDQPDRLDALLPIVRDKNLLSDVPYLEAMSRQPEFIETISLRFSEKAGVWSPGPLESLVQKKTFDLIALHWKVEDPRWETHRYSRLGPRLRKDIEQNYTLCGSADDVFFYTPTLAMPGQNSDCAHLQAELSHVR